jgi:hypothetical protein
MKTTDYTSRQYFCAIETKKKSLYLLVWEYAWTKITESLFIWMFVFQIMH